MKKSWLSKLLFAGVMAGVLSSTVSAQSLKLAYALSKESHYGAAAFALEKSLAENTNGKFTIEHFANSALGGEREVIEGLQLGTVDAAVLSTGAILNFVPQAGVFDIPFLFRDLAHARKVLDSEVGQDMLKAFAKNDLVALAWGEQGFRHFTNNKVAVKEPADAKGLKIRTTENPVHITAFKQLGILATPMAWPEVQTALQQGTIDGQENPMSVIVAAKLNQQQKFLSLTGHVYAPAVVVFSPSVYNGLSSAEKDHFLAASKAAAQAMRDFVDNVEKTGLASLKEAGMTVTEDVNREAFSAIVKEVYPEYYKRFSKELIDSIVAQ